MAAVRVLSTLPLIMVMFGSCSPWNNKTRQVSREQPLPAGDSAYIESHRAGGNKYGFSFIEFYGKGSFLGEDQFQKAFKVLHARKAGSDANLFNYCHWRMNNTPSR